MEGGNTSQWADQQIARILHGMVLWLKESEGVIGREEVVNRQAALLDEWEVEYLRAFMRETLWVQDKLREEKDTEG
jgi:hypothetical protein